MHARLKYKRSASIIRNVLVFKATQGFMESEADTICEVEHLLLHFSAFLVSPSRLGSLCDILNYDARASE
jgi:hypothetical protein